MSNDITGSTNSNNIPSQNVAPPPADATTSSADSAQQTNPTEPSPALVVTTESTTMADTVFSSTSVGYQQHMSLEAASLPDMFSAAIANQKLLDKMAEEMSKTTSALMDGMSQVASQMMDASKAIQNKQIDDIAEQSKKKKKRKIFGWIAKIATVVASVAMIATGVGAGIGVAMLAMTAVQLACKPFGGLDAALGKLFPDSKVAQAICKAVVVAAVVATAVMTGGASLVSTGILVASNMYSEQLTHFMTEQLHFPPWLAQVVLLATQIVAGIGIYKSAAAVGNISAGLKTAANVAAVMGGLAGGAATIAQGAIDIDLANLTEKISQSKADMLALHKNVKLITEQIDKHLAENTEDAAKYSGDGMAFLTKTMDTAFQGSKSIKI